MSGFARAAGLKLTGDGQGEITRCAFEHQSKFYKSSHNRRVRRFVAIRRSLKR